MSQLFIFGASSAYGAGGASGGWGDRVKRHLHEQMFSPGGCGEKNRVHICAKPGATIDWLEASYAQQLELYRHTGRTVAIVCIGLNNSKATGTPDNFVCTIENYEQQMHQLLSGLKKATDHLVCVGYSPVNESRMPLVNEFGTTYFSNHRIRAFNTVLARICHELQVTFISVDVAVDEWIATHLYEDGLHPNDRGHTWIFESVLPTVSRYV